MDFNINISMPETLVNGVIDFDFVFCGFEDDNRQLVKRFDLKTVSKDHCFSFSCSSEPVFLIIWPHKEGEWLESIEIELNPVITPPKYCTGSINIEDNKKRILYIGQSGSSGYANAAKGYITDFFIKGFNIEWFPLVFDDTKECSNYVDILCESLKIKDIGHNYDEVYLHCTPDLWPSYIKTYGDNFKGATVIGVSVWETDLLPEEWLNALNSVDFNIVPSTFNKEVYTNSGVIKPIVIRPHLFYKQYLPEKANINIITNNCVEMSPEKYTFYNISEFNNRKGIEDAIEVFSDVYGDNKDVQFLIKTHYRNYDNENVKFCLAELNKLIKCNNIGVIVSPLSYRHILAMHSWCDCYLSLHKGEGYGLVLNEAHNYNNPVVTTGYGGHLDFFTSDYSYLVDYTLENINDNMETFNRWYNSNQKWAIPDKEHAKKLITEVYRTYKK